LGLPESKIRHLEIASASWPRYFYIQISELFELAPICLPSLYVGIVIAFYLITDQGRGNVINNFASGLAKK
jgi:hypothetical protein